MTGSAGRADLIFAKTDLRTTIPARFEAVARAQPDRLALTGNGRRWTYDELNRQANRLAHAVRDRTTPGPGRVACLVDQSPEMIVAALAVLKAGKTCVAIHPGLPPHARAAVQQHAGAALLLTTVGLAADARATTTDALDVLCIDDPGRAEPDANPSPTSTSDDLALILYTSGSTGEPKGVAWSHRKLLHRVWLSTQYEAFTPDDRQSLLTHCYFAGPQADVYGALMQGAALCVFDVKVHGLAAFGGWLDAEGITLLRAPAALLRQFMAGLDERRTFPHVRAVSVGGAVTPADVQQWKRHFPAPARLFLRFAISETAVVTVAPIDHDTAIDSASSLAGMPVPDKTLTIVDDEGRDVEQGTEGELVVTSTYLADGYWDGPSKTARAFPADPQQPGQCSFRTGDRGRLLPDGRFEFLGRRDDQVKIRGFRVELREVEAELRQDEAVSEAAVLAVRTDDQARLAAFVVPPVGVTCDAAALRARLSERLPDWKVPAQLHVVDALPMTLSGKVDRQRLVERARHLETDRARTLGSDDAGLDPFERAIAQQWRRILRSGPVARTDDFFLSGGDSLQATMLHLEVERIAGRRIPLELLFRTPTLGAMARAAQDLDQASPVSQAAAVDAALPAVLVPFRRTGTQTPLFLVHGRMGRAVVRPEFLEILGADQPVYGLQAAGLDRTKMPQNTVPLMAQQYVDAIRAVQPTGPYFLGAACAGGIVVAEMANQLRAEGEVVGPLLLFDPPAFPLGDRARWRRRLLEGRARLQKRFPSSRWNTAAALLRRRGAARQGQLAEREALEAAVWVAMDFRLAVLKHHGWSYDGPVLLLRSERRLRREGPGTGRGTFTEHLTGSVQRFEAGLTHNEVVRGSSALAAQQIRHAARVAREALAALSGRAPAAGLPVDASRGAS
ncbi:MAG: AMP-binding protein [Vicinamibacterales bacterium]